MRIYRFFMAFTGIEAGRWCRHCGEAIGRKDAFGLSEGVCASCRH